MSPRTTPDLSTGRIRLRRGSYPLRTASSSSKLANTPGLWRCRLGKASTGRSPLTLPVSGDPDNAACISGAGEPPTGNVLLLSECIRIAQALGRLLPSRTFGRMVHTTSASAGSQPTALNWPEPSVHETPISCGLPPTCSDGATTTRMRTLLRRLDWTRITSLRVGTRTLRQLNLNPRNLRTGALWTQMRLTHTLWRGSSTSHAATPHHGRTDGSLQPLTIDGLRGQGEASGGVFLRKPPQQRNKRTLSGPLRSPRTQTMATQTRPLRHRASPCALALRFRPSTCIGGGASQPIGYPWDAPQP
jgi:hypothetical protein